MNKLINLKPIKKIPELFLAWKTQNPIADSKEIKQNNWQG